MQTRIEKIPDCLQRVGKHFFKVSPDDEDYFTVISQARAKLENCVVPSTPLYFRRGMLRETEGHTSDKQRLEIYSIDSEKFRRRRTTASNPHASHRCTGCSSHFNCRLVHKTHLHRRGSEHTRSRSSRGQVVGHSQELARLRLRAATTPKAEFMRELAKHLQNDQGRVVL